MTTSVYTPFDRFDSISLDQIEREAALQRRIDRKYVVRPDELEELIELLDGDVRILEIDGERRFGYESVYFDTPSFESYLGAARRRPNRFKVRTRTYLSTGTCWIEMKLRTRQGQTVKHRRSHDVGRRDRLTAESLEFITGFPALQQRAFELEPAMRTSYSRTTLLHDGQRVTIDTDLACTEPRSGTAESVGIGDNVIVETKSVHQPGAVDRALWSIGVRPTKISKFAIGMATFHPGLPANKWHRTLQRCVRAQHWPE